MLRRYAVLLLLLLVGAVSLALVGQARANPGVHDPAADPARQPTPAGTVVPAAALAAWLAHRQPRWDGITSPQATGAPRPAVPAFGPDVRVSYDNPGLPHGEPFVAADPVDPLHFIAGGNE